MKLTILFLIIFVVGALARPDGSMESVPEADQNEAPSASMEKTSQSLEQQGNQITAPLEIKYIIEDLYQNYVPGFVQTIVNTINSIIPGIISGPINIPLETLHTAIMQSNVVNSILEDNPITTTLEKIPIIGDIVPYVAETIGIPVNIINFIIHLIGTFIYRAL